MPNWLKVVLIVGGLLLLLLVASVGVLVYLGMKHGPALVEAGKHAVEDGRAYGQGTDEQGCVNEAVARHGRAQGFSDMLGSNLFLRSCLEVSRTTPNFCDEVPSRLEFMKGARWQMDECKRHGLAPERPCGQLFEQVQQYCDVRGRTKTGAHASPEDYPKDATGADDSEPPPPPPPPARPHSRK